MKDTVLEQEKEHATKQSVTTLLVIMVVSFSLPANAQIVVTEGTNLRADVSRTDGRIAFDLLGKIWILPASGGQATALPKLPVSARSPRWSPSGQFLLYQSSSTGISELWLYDLQSEQPRRLSNGQHSEQMAAWHPDGERVVFSSTAGGGGLNLWELDIATGLRWRIVAGPGDETEAAWSANGRHLVYVLHNEDGWSLMLRRHGEPDQRLLQSARSIRAPSWRPDGSLVTFLRETDDGFSFDMVILSDPPLIRQYSDTEKDLFLSPVSWLDRQRMVYTADGQILTRKFGARRASPIRFRANIAITEKPEPIATAKRRLPVVTPPSYKLVIRAARLYDGLHDKYRHNIDVVTDGALIAAVERRREWPDATVLDLGNVTILPGFIDLFSALPQRRTNIAGAGLLAYGITTLVTDDDPGTIRPDSWHGEDSPGPRLILAANIATASIKNADDYYVAAMPTPAPSDPIELVQQWRKRGIPVIATYRGAGLGPVAGSLPASPLGLRYQDRRITTAPSMVTPVSGLADARTPGLRSLLNSRQAHRFGHNSNTVRQFEGLSVPTSGSPIVLGSKANGLPPGLALHAELRALAAAGLDGTQALQSAGSNISKLLGLEQQIGQITPGAFADLVLVTGDPLARVSDTLNIVAVVRNGRFYSLVSLLERAGTEATVE